MSESNSNSITGNIGKWLAVVSTVLTIGLTALNAYWSRQVSESETAMKMQAAELEKQRLELDAGKERIARYTFVQNLLNGVLAQDEAQKNLTVNLITLALTESEAERLFAGLQASDDEGTKAVGSIGRELVAISNLVSLMNDAVKQTRMGAVENLINNYRDNSSAVNQALSMLEPPKLDELSASGRINVLVFLSNTEKNAWTAENIARAERGLIILRKREDQGVKIGPQTEAAINRFEKHLNTVKD